MALVFSTKYQPPPNIFDRWQLWQEWKTRYFGFHRDLTPEAAAPVLGGKLVYLEYRHGQWGRDCGGAVVDEVKQEFSDAPVFHSDHP